MQWSWVRFQAREKKVCALLFVIFTSVFKITLGNSDNFSSTMSYSDYLLEAGLADVCNKNYVGA